MTRAHGILALLWAAALAWAFALTQPGWWPADAADRPIPLWTLDAKDLQRVEYRDGASRVMVTFDAARLLPDGAPAPWLEAEGPAAEPDAPRPPLPPRPGAPKPDLKKPPAPQPGAAGGTPQTAAKIKFRGGPAASRVVQDLARLAALRDLGRLDEKRRGEFGLATPAGTLRLERAGGEPLILDLGNAPPGGGTRYAMLRASGRVYLVNQGVLRSFDRARRLMDREWMPFSPAEIKRIDAKLEGKTLTVWQLALPRTEPQRWARKADAPKGEPNALKWVQALQGMKVLDYAAPADTPAQAGALLEIAVTPAEGKPAAGGAAAPASAEPVTLRVFKSAGKNSDKLRAESGYTGAPVELGASAVQSVIDQARELLKTKQ
jgi:hypothetical protein